MLIISGKNYSKISLLKLKEYSWLLYYSHELNLLSLNKKKYPPNFKLPLHNNKDIVIVSNCGIFH